MRKNRRPKIKKKCLNCGIEFMVWQSRLDIGKGKFCSTKCGKIGKFSPFWKGGKKKCNGYIYIKCENHPNATIGGYVKEHRLIMEKYIGRYLDKKEVVHHINGIRDDNRIENLKLYESQSFHYINHMRGNKIWLGKKHTNETIMKMKDSWTEKRKIQQGTMYKGLNNPNYRHGKYISI